MKTKTYAALSNILSCTEVPSIFKMWTARRRCFNFARRDGLGADLAVFQVTFISGISVLRRDVPKIRTSLGYSR